MRDISHFPYEIPGAFGGSIFLACPFLFLLFREGPRDYLKPLCWITIAVLTCLLWLHGNPGGYQFSYRYAIILLPWFFLLLLRNGPRRASATEISLFAFPSPSTALRPICFYGQVKSNRNRCAKTWRRKRAANGFTLSTTLQLIRRLLQRGRRAFRTQAFLLFPSGLD